LGRTATVAPSSLPFAWRRLGASGLAVWTKSGFPERSPALPGIDMRKIGDAKLDADFKPTKA